MKMLRQSSAGFTLIEALGALLVITVLMPAIAYLWQKGAVELRKRSVADHFTAVAKAADKYARQNYTTLLASSSINAGPSISLAALRAANCLPLQVADNNAWGQGYQILGRKTASGDLTIAVLTTGGRGDSVKEPAFANVVVPETAAMARAGFIPTGLIGASNVLRGAHGGWEVNLANMGLSGTAGHLGQISTLSAADLGQDFLYRVAVPGHPELNEMSTELDMTDHAIRGAKEVQFTPHDYSLMSGFCGSAADEGRTFLDAKVGLYLCREGKARVIGDTGNSVLMQEAQLAANWQTITKPICPTGSATHPEIFVAPSIVASGADAPPAASMQAWAVSLSATEWQVRLRVLTAENEWIYPTGNYGRMMVFTTCARD